MRIIGGIHRHRTLLGPKGTQTTRPITDRVKQSLFDRLMSLAVFGGPCLDLFSGTGSMGLEALSRGAPHCTFVERHRGSRSILEQNIEALRLTDEATVLSSDLSRGTWTSLLTHTPVELIFCDPPYEMAAADMETVTQIIELCTDLMVPEGILVLRTDDRAVPSVVEGWLKPVAFAYGSMRLFLYERQGPETDAED